MSSSIELYHRIAGVIKKWINKKFPEDRKVRLNGSRGPLTRFTDDDLVEIALKVKAELRGEKINPSNLQQCTGGIIGRQIWRRRIQEKIDLINKPMVDGRELDLDKNDEINHVNIDYIIERYGTNPMELVNQLFYLEESRINLYNKAKELEKENERLVKAKEENEKLSKENRKLKEELLHYVTLSNNLYISSYFPNMREKVGLKGNAISMGLNPSKSTNTNISVLFPTSKELEDNKECVEEILELEKKKSGEEMYDRIADKFGDFWDG